MYCLGQFTISTKNISLSRELCALRFEKIGRSPGASPAVYHSSPHHPSSRNKQRRTGTNSPVYVTLTDLEQQTLKVMKLAPTTMISSSQRSVARIALTLRLREPRSPRLGAHLSAMHLREVTLNVKSVSCYSCYRTNVHEK